ncbi:MAG: PAS domain-containing protein [Bacteroidales bacterium]|nr:PAS domain-containing protein [Bacteroidales bacterium]
MTSTDFLNLLDNSPTAIVVSDENNKIIFSNENAKITFGIDPKTGHELSIKKFYSTSPIRWEEIKEKVLQKGSFIFNSSAKKATGGIIEVSVLCKAIHFNDKTAIVCYINDISDQQIILREHFKEQQFRQLLLDSIPAMIFVKDNQNRIIAMNKCFRDATGLSMDMILGKQVSDLIDNKLLADEFWKDDLEVIQTGLPKRNIVEPLLNDPKRWFVTDKIPYRTLDGEIVGVIGFSIEITDRKNAEDALITSEKKFRLLFDTSPDGIILCTLEGMIISTNNVFLNMIGYTSEELAKRSIFDLSADKDKEEELPVLRNSILFGDTVDSVERNYIRKDGTIMPVAVKGWIIKDPVGTPIQMGAFIKDISLQKKAEKLERSLLEKEKEQLELDLESKNRDLNSKIAQLIEKTGLVQTVMGQLEHLIETQPENIEEELKEIVNNLRQDKTEDFWSQFELTFRQVNQSFYDKIYQSYPKLSNNEKKISAFLKMNLSTKDISNITHQSVRSIEMARTRLRKKLNLNRSDNLTAFLSQF